MPRIDTHAHVLPALYIEALPPTLAATHKPIPVEGLDAMMQRYAIDAAVISTGPPGVFFGDTGQARELARLVNEELAAIVRAAPRRFAALASLPLPGVDGALAELAHALDTLQLDGVMLVSQVAGAYLGDPRFEPLMVELDRRGSYVFVHPTFPPNGQPLAHHPVWLYEFPFETTRAIANLIYSGVFERHPRIRWQFAHLGGTAPFIAHRLASLAEREPDQTASAPAGALAYLARQYYDTGLNNHEVAVEATRQVAPFDHIVFGTDWPYLALPDGEDVAPGLTYLGSEERALLEGEHARALVPRLFA
ncbi:MAG TPA: amidohydrolase family protein [Solirubrobacteraceae bacterium]|jgi:predicted TIM-barrel fold metal-dependent hydrolase|nr:amidohydrolase family protein [Solirubrobacteraceae bacterium]